MHCTAAPYGADWFDICSCPGFYGGRENDQVDDTVGILSLSYYDLPSHLKACLLYLSAFPEDTLIDKVSLIWKWIAEGFVEEKLGRGSFEVGEEYFYNLINRSMIQGADSQVYGIIDGCRVHDMVLDLIVSISHEEKFVCADGGLSESPTRRLATKNSEVDLTQDTRVKLPQLRSFIVWQCAIAKWAIHPRLKLIRVLALKGCTFGEGCKRLERIGNLLHLRYLRIRGSWFKELPEEIGNLKFLQTLDLQDIGYLQLPCSIGRLTQLVCLRAPEISAPVGVIGKLTSLEELSISCEKDEFEAQFVKDLGNLCGLRVLEIHSRLNTDESMEIDLVQSLGNLVRMQHLRINLVIHSIDVVRMNVWDAAVPSQDLRCLFLPYVRFHKLPSWMSSAHLPSLSHLEITVNDMDQQGLKALGGLSELCYLNLYIDGTVTSNTESNCWFQKLRSLVLCFSMVQFVANEDSSVSISICHMHKGMANGSRKKDNCGVVPAVVMPKLEELEFSVGVKELADNNIVSCDNLGLEYLPSLQRVNVHWRCDGAFEDDVNREEAALRHALEVHPKRPTFQIVCRDKERMKRRSAEDASVQPPNEEDEEDTSDDAGSTVGGSC